MIYPRIRVPLANIGASHHRTLCWLLPCMWWSSEPRWSFLLCLARACLNASVEGHFRRKMPMEAIDDFAGTLRNDYQVFWTRQRRSLRRNERNRRSTISRQLRLSPPLGPWHGFHLKLRHVPSTCSAQRYAKCYLILG